MRKTAILESNVFMKLAILVIACAVIVGFVSYREYKIARLHKYFDAVDTAVKPMNAIMANINRDVAVFQGDIETAKQIQAELKQAESVTAKTETRLRAIKPPDEAAVYHQDLIKLANASRRFLVDLSSFFEYLIDRNNAISGFAAQISVLNEQLRMASDEASLLDVFNALQVKTDGARSSLSSLRKPRIQIFSDEVLKVYLDETSAALVQLQTAIQSKDDAAAQAAATNLSAILNRDWNKSLIVADPVGAKALAEREKDLQNLQSSVSMKRARI